MGHNVSGMIEVSTEVMPYLADGQIVQYGAVHVHASDERSAGDRHVQARTGTYRPVQVHTRTYPYIPVLVPDWP